MKLCADYVGLLFLAHPVYSKIIEKYMACEYFPGWYIWRLPQDSVDTYWKSAVHQVKTFQDTTSNMMDTDSADIISSGLKSGFIKM